MTVIRGDCTCGHEESDGRHDVLDCAVHGFEARSEQARRTSGEASEVVRAAMAEVVMAGSVWIAPDRVDFVCTRVENGRAVMERDVMTPSAKVRHVPLGDLAAWRQEQPT